MFCRHCGSKLETTSRFCLQCGKPVEENTPSQNPLPKTQKQSTPATQANSGKNAPKKKSNSQAIVIIAVVAALLLLISACVCVFFVFDFSDFSLFGDRESSEFRDDDDDDEEDEKEDEEDKDGEEDEEDEGDDKEGEQTEPTEEETVDPIPVPTTNPYRECYNETQYILSQSDSRYYSPAELKDLTDNELKVAYAEITARHGEAPSDQHLQEYFDCLSWYTPSSTSTTLNTYEEENLFLISVCQRQRDGSIYRTSNPYMVYFGNEDSYFLTASDSTYVTGDALYRMSQTELILARNEIFARHGYIFKDEVLREYFSCKSWYQPTTLSADFDTAVFCDQENANIQLIKVYEDIADGVTMSSGNKFRYYYNPYNNFIFYDSNSRLLQEWDVMYLDVNQLIIARNEIFARKGYCFTDDELMEYFLQFSWYRPQVAPGRLDLISLNSTERANVNYLLEYQDFKEEMNTGYGSYYG